MLVGRRMKHGKRDLLENIWKEHDSGWEGVSL